MLWAKSDRLLYTHQVGRLASDLPPARHVADRLQTAWLSLAAHLAKFC